MVHIFKLNLFINYLITTKKIKNLLILLEKKIQTFAENVRDYHWTDFHAGDFKRKEIAPVYLPSLLLN